MLTYVQRYVITTTTQGLLYGIYFATLTQCFRWFIFADDGWKPREKITSISFNPMAFGAIFIFLMTTVNLMTTFAHEIENIRRDEMQLYRDGIDVLINISQTLVIISIDGILIYRCWIVYEKSWRVICVPVAFWLASLTCSAIYLYMDQSSLDFVQTEEKVIASLYGCNIVTTIYTTIAIIYRIRCTRKTSDSPKRLDHIMRILVESGALYTFTLFFGLVGSVLISGKDPTWVDDLIFDISDAINFSTAGISFNLLLIRVYQIRSRAERWDSRADSRNDDGLRTLSEMQFNDAQITASSEGPPSTGNARPVDEVIDEIKSSDGMHVN